MPDSLPPTPVPTANSESLLSPESVAWMAAAVLLALAAVVGFLFGGVLRNLAQRW